MKFYKVAFSNFRENSPKILTSEPWNINVVYITLDEESEKNKIENCTISEDQIKDCFFTWKLYE